MNSFHIRNLFCSHRFFTEGLHSVSLHSDSQKGFWPSFGRCFKFGHHVLSVIYIINCVVCEQFGPLVFTFATTLQNPGLNRPSGIIFIQLNLFFIF